MCYSSYISPSQSLFFFLFFFSVCYSCFSTSVMEMGSHRRTKYFMTTLRWNLTISPRLQINSKVTPQNVNPGSGFGKFCLRMSWLVTTSRGLTQAHGSPITPASAESRFLPKHYSSGPVLIVTRYVAPRCTTWLPSGPSQLPFWPAHPAEEPRSRKLGLLSVRISEKNPHRMSMR